MWWPWSRNLSARRTAGGIERERLPTDRVKASSPDPLHAVAVEGLVSADDGEILEQGLRDDQTVEGIAVMKGHDCHLADVGNVKRQHRDAVLA